MWHVATAGRTAGPLTIEQIRQGIAAGQVTMTSHVWTVGMSGWAPIASVPALAALFLPPPPPPA